VDAVVDGVVVDGVVVDGIVVGTGLVVFTAWGAVFGLVVLTIVGVMPPVVGADEVVVVASVPRVFVGKLVGAVGGTDVLVVVGAPVGDGVVRRVVVGGALAFLMVGWRYRMLVTLDDLDVTDGQSAAATSAAPLAGGWQFSPAAAVAVFSSLPCRSWAAVTVSVAEQLVVSPTDSAVVGQTTVLRPTSGSFTVS
jgi:hypothetical protein